MATIAENDPTRFKDRTVKPEKGKGRKIRPRVKNWASSKDGAFSCFIS